MKDHGMEGTGETRGMSIRVRQKVMVRVQMLPSERVRMPVSKGFVAGSTRAEKLAVEELFG